MPPCGYGRASARHYGNGVAVSFLRPLFKWVWQAREKKSHATFGDGREHWPHCVLALCRNHACYGHLPRCRDPGLIPKDMLPRSLKCSHCGHRARFVRGASVRPSEATAALVQLADDPMQEFLDEQS